MFEKHEVRGFFIVLCGIMFPVLIMNILIAVLSANNSDIESKVERPTHILSWFYMPSVNPCAAELSTRSGCDVIRGQIILSWLASNQESKSIGGL